MKHLIFAAFACLALPAHVNSADLGGLAAMSTADVVILGEVHDNPHHHEEQTRLTEKLQPAALVFEMLSTDQAARITHENRLDESALAADLAWDQSGWPDFAMYFPIMAAAPEARIFGAGLDRAAAREAIKQGILSYFGAEAARYGLDLPLGDAEQAVRQDFKFKAHCDALPKSMLPMMVDVQRLRDAFLARAVVRALEETGGPVVVITGNGHARKDWGLGVYLDRARPGLGIFALGQSEDGQIEGVFDAVLDSPAIERPDPCLVFQNKG